MRTAFFQRLENFWRRATRLCARRRCFWASWNQRGLPIPFPSFRVTHDNSPTSRPTALSFAGSGSGSTTQLKQAYHAPCSRLSVSVLIWPLIGRCNLILISPIFESHRRPFSWNPACAWAFSTIASAGATRPRNEVLEGSSPVAIVFRRWVLAVPCPVILKEYIEQQKVPH